MILDMLLIKHELADYLVNDSKINSLLGATLNQALMREPSSPALPWKLCFPVGNIEVFVRVCLDLI